MLLTKRAHLSVRAAIYETAQPEFLKKAINDYRFSRIRSIKPTEEYKNLFERVSRSKGYAVLTFSNQSKRRIAGIAVSINGSYHDTIIEVHRGKDVLPATIKNRADVGVLQPRETCEIRVWADLGFPEHSIKEFFHITADEYDKITFYIERPKFISNRYFLLRKGVVWATFWLLVLILNVALLLLKPA